jgi:hypothetical protein
MLVRPRAILLDSVHHNKNSKAVKERTYWPPKLNASSKRRFLGVCIIVSLSLGLVNLQVSPAGQGIRLRIMN